MAFCRSTPGLQLLIVPSSVTKMKTLEPVWPFAVTTNPGVPLKIVPVGAAGGGPPGGGGNVTTKGDPTGETCPSPCLILATPVSLSAILIRLVGEKTDPH